MRRQRGERVLLAAAVAEAVMICWLSVALLARPAVPVAVDIPRAASAAAAADRITIPEIAAPSSEPTPRAPAAASTPVAGSAPPPYGVLVGRVRDPGGRPVREAMISLHSGDEAKPLAHFTTRVGNPGFALPLPPGHYRLRARAQGYRDFDDEFDLPAGRVERDVMLARAWQLRVELVDRDGQPLAEALRKLYAERPRLAFLDLAVIATADPPGDALMTTDLRQPEVGVGTWRDAFQARLPRRFFGCLDLPEERPLYVSATLRIAVLSTLPVAAGQEEVRLTVPIERVLGAFGSVRLRLVEGIAGKPVAGAQVALNDVQSGTPGEVTDADGRVELKFLRPGRLELHVRGTSLTLPQFAVDLAPGASVDLGTLAMVAPVALGIRYEGVAPDVTVDTALVPRHAPPHAALRPASLRIAPQAGVFRADVAPGPYRLRAMGGDAMALVEFDTAQLGGEPLVVRLSTSAKLRVLPPPPGSAVQIQIRDSGGGSVYRLQPRNAQPFDLQLPPGRYAVQITRGATVEHRPLEVPPHGAQLDLR